MKNEIYKNSEVENKMVTIDLIEYQPTWIKYHCEMEVTEKDFEEYKNGNITISDLIEKYKVKYLTNEDICEPVEDMKSKYEVLV